jgi:hypothetical protein
MPLAGTTTKDEGWVANSHQSSQDPGNEIVGAWIHSHNSWRNSSETNNPEELEQW